MNRNYDSSLKLSLIGYALSSWISGSKDLRNAFIPRPHFSTFRSNRTPDTQAASAGTQIRDSDSSHILRKILSFFQRPSKELDERETKVSGLIDVSLAIFLLKSLGSTSVLSLILLNPFGIVLPLPKNISIEKLQWHRVLLYSVGLAVLHEVQRVTVSSVLHMQDEQAPYIQHDEIKDIKIIGEPIQADESDAPVDDEACLICSGTINDLALSESTGSITNSRSSTDVESPLECFCINAPKKHLMHRNCFLAWRSYCWEERSRNGSAIIALSCEDGRELRGHTPEFQRCVRILKEAKFGLSDDLMFAISNEIDWINDPRISHEVSTFTLRSGYREDPPLATMTTRWPTCPACRSPIRMNFTLPEADKQAAQNNHQEIHAQEAQTWLEIWRSLVTGRTILWKTVSQLVIILSVFSALKYRKLRNL